MNKQIKFSIVTPTHNRPELVSRCIKSVLSQKVNKDSIFSVEHIIVNDSPDYNYFLVESNYLFINSITEGNIIYIKNKENKGNNYSHNIGLTNVSFDSTHVIFLDDDDWLSPDALLQISLVLQGKNDTDKHNNTQWLVANRALNNGTSLTKNNTNKKVINYFCDYLMDYLFLNKYFKKLSGDVTHIIDKDLAQSAYFSKYVKNGEEWYYFLQLTSTFDYVDINITLSDGYADDGMTKNLKNKYIYNTHLLWKEVLSKFYLLRFNKNNSIKIKNKTKIIFYLLLRTLNIFRKKLQDIF